MRAMLLREQGTPLELVDLPEPTAGPGEVVVRVRACGLGLTVVWNRDGRGAPGADRLAPKLPRVIGHEVTGEVVEVGTGVRGVAEGDGVAVYYYLTCGGICQLCASGRDDLCDHFAGYVGQHVDGGLAEFVRLPAINVRPLPDGVDWVDGAVATDALATPLHVLRSRARLRQAETVLVVGGGGGVGVHMVAMARALGARAICVDIGEEKLALARDAGAEAAIDATDGPFDEAVADHTGGRGADVVVEMVSTEDTIGPSLRSLSKIGRLVLVGTYAPGTPMNLSVRSIRGEQEILASRYCTRAELSETLAMVAAGLVKPIVTRTCALEESSLVLDAIRDRQVAGRAAAIL